MILQAIKHLQLTLSPFEYVQVLDEEKAGYWEKWTVYWDRLPTYLVSRCPLCEARYTSKIDPHSLMGWSATSHEGQSGFYTSKHEHVGCGHRMRVQMFVNQEGNIPSEMWNNRNEMFVPFVIPWLVPDDIPSVAVIHSFTICRIEDEIGRVYDYKTNSFRKPLATIEAVLSQEHSRREARNIEKRSMEDTIALEKAKFVPRYTAYAMVYYAEDSETIIRRRIQSELAGTSDPEYWPWVMPAQGWLSADEVHDLPYWVKRGKLQWLDLDSSELFLKADPVEDFPYTNIYRELTVQVGRGWIQR
ncbi:MAG: hypothetical protein H6658_21045 [Ardenticatenaceae bacterium]|nr:hypothetical protein [Ardenticatenaceae bacterium]